MDWFRRLYCRESGVIVREVYRVRRGEQVLVARAARSRYIRLVRDRGRGPVYITPGSRDELRTSGTTVISSPASCRLCGTSTSCVSSARVLGYRFSLRRFPCPASRASRLPLSPLQLLATARIVRQSELGTAGDSLRASAFFLDRGNLKRARERDWRAVLPRARE